MHHKIAVIGTSNIDLTMKVSKIPGPGETVAGGVFTQTFGGKGANQAVAAARAGGDVSFITCLGTDRFAEAVMERLEENNIDTTNVFQESGVSTGTAMVTVDETGENSISIAPGANHRLTERHLQKAMPTIREARVVLLQGDLRNDLLKYLLQLTYSEQKRVLLNLAPAQELAAEFLKRVAVLVVNEQEISAILGRRVSDIDQVRQAAREVAAISDGGVIVSMGEKGSCLVKDDRCDVVPAYKVKAVDITGAGDAYCGSLAAALVEGMAPLDAMKFATAAAAISVTRMGAQPSIPYREEIEEFMSNNQLL